METALSLCSTRVLEPKGNRLDIRLSYHVPGHRQKLEDQAKPFTDRYGELERLRQSMRVTPTTPNPRGSLSTPSHFGSQAQTPIQGNWLGAPARRRTPNLRAPDTAGQGAEPSPPPRGWRFRAGVQLSPG